MTDRDTTYEVDASDAADARRLAYLVAHDVSFGRTSAGDVIGGEYVWSEARFAHVPCRYLYEWHCYDGETWRHALDAVMAAGPCVGRDGECVHGRLCTGYDRELAARLAAGDAAVADRDSLRAFLARVGCPECDGRGEYEGEYDASTNECPRLPCPECGGSGSALDGYELWRRTMATAKPPNETAF